LVRQDPALDFDWGYGSPDPVVNSDYFSARWTRYIDVTPGTYRFTAEADDGMRVWVNNEMIIDAWREQPPTVYTAEIYLGPGHHLVRVEYFERAQRAVARLSWQRVDVPAPQPTAIPTAAPGQWQADYFNNVSLSGPPVVSRMETEINYDWGEGSPDLRVNRDYFSARWSRNLDVPAGHYRFNLRVDDGARLFVNGHTLIDAWRAQSATNYSGDIFLPGGPATVQLEYFEQTGSALVQLNWHRLDAVAPTATPTAAPAAWSRYVNTTLRVSLDYPSYWLRQSSSLFNDRYAGTDGFFTASAKAATNLNAAVSSEAYHVLQPYGSSPTIESLTVAGQPARLILPSGDQHTGMRQQAALVMQYDQPLYVGSDSYGFFILRASQPFIRQMVESLSLLAPGTVPPPTATSVPTAIPHPTATPSAPAAGAVIVDDNSAGFVRGGNASGWRIAYEGYNGRLVWSQNNAQVQTGYNWARWYPALRPARYEVFVYIPDRYTTTSNARYWVSHAGGFTLRTVDQSRNGGRWVSLGTYTFRGTDMDYVSLADVTYEPYLSRLIAWDAVKWEPR
jgi:hypothetical protein